MVCRYEFWKRTWCEKIGKCEKDSLMTRGSFFAGFRFSCGAGALIVDERLAWIRNEKCEMVVRRQILRLSSHCSAFTWSNIRHFTPLRMAKCAAKYKSWRCYELVYQSLVTSHLRLLIPSYSSFLSNFWDSPFPYRHPERSRGIFLGKHWFNRCQILLLNLYA